MQLCFVDTQFVFKMTFPFSVRFLFFFSFLLFASLSIRSTFFSSSFTRDNPFNLHFFWHVSFSIYLWPIFLTLNNFPCFQIIDMKHDYDWLSLRDRRERKKQQKNRIERGKEKERKKVRCIYWLRSRRIWFYPFLFK